MGWDLESFSLVQSLSVLCDLWGVLVQSLSVLDTVGKVGRAAVTEVFLVFGYGGDGGKGSCPVQQELITSKH